VWVKSEGRGKKNGPGPEDGVVIIAVQKISSHLFPLIRAQEKERKGGGRNRISCVTWRGTGEEERSPVLPYVTYCQGPDVEGEGEV